MSETNTSGFNTTTTEDGFNITSSHESAEQLTETLKPEPKPEEAEEQPKDPKLSKAAAELGKKGGETTAAKRAAEKEQAEAEKPDAPAATEPEKPLGKPRDDPRARMLEATRKEAEAKRRAEAAEARALAAERALAEKEAGKAAADPTKAPAKEAPKDAKPKVEDFEKYEDYVEALADYKAEQRVQRYQKETEEQQKAAAERAGINRVATTFYQRNEEAAKADPTYWDRTKEVAIALQPSFMRAPGAPIEFIHVLSDEIVSSEQAPALMLHFSEHPDEIQRILALRNPFAITKAVSRIEGRLEKLSDAAPLPTAPRAEISRAKPPVRPVAGAPHTSAEPDPDSSSFDDHLQFYNAKERRG